MAGIKVVCKEHGFLVGGCNCLGAQVKVVDCPCMADHEAVVKIAEDEKKGTVEYDWKDSLRDIFNRRK